MRLYDLTPLAKAEADKQGITLGEFVRRSVAMALKVPAPNVIRGNPNIAAMSAYALKTRWQVKRQGKG